MPKALPSIGQVREKFEMKLRSESKLIDLNSKEFLTVGFSCSGRRISGVELQVWKKATAGTIPHAASRRIMLSKNAGSRLGRALLKAIKFLEG